MALCLKKFVVYCGEEIATLGYVVDVFLPLNFGLYLRISNWSANESKILLLSDQSLEERCQKWHPGE